MKVLKPEEIKEAVGNKVVVVPENTVTGETFSEKDERPQVMKALDISKEEFKEIKEKFEAVELSKKNCKRLICFDPKHMKKLLRIKDDTDIDYSTVVNLALKPWFEQHFEKVLEMRYVEYNKD